MNWEQIEGKFDQYKGKLKNTWGKLTDDDLTQLKGKRDRLIGILQEKYGKSKDAIEKEIDNFLDKLK